MEIKIHKNDNSVFLVDLSGDMDLYSSNQLKDLVMKMIENKVECLVLNLTDIKSIYSAGIGALVYVSSTLKNLNYPLVVVAPPDGPALKALEITRLKNYFTIVPSVKEAAALAAAKVQSGAKPGR